MRLTNSTLNVDLVRNEFQESGGGNAINYVSKQSAGINLPSSSADNFMTELPRDSVIKRLRSVNEIQNDTEM